jgi:hypothetical protein
LSSLRCDGLTHKSNSVAKTSIAQISAVEVRSSGI